MRPIAVGETLRRVIAKWLVRSTAAVGLAHGLAPLQTAFAKGGPCEVASMCYATAAAGMPTGPDGALHAMLQLDISNAFNTIDREVVLAELRSNCPSLLPWVHASFQPAPLLCGKQTLWSTAGVQQGDPLGPLLFATGLQSVLCVQSPGRMACIRGTWMMAR